MRLGFLVHLNGGDDPGIAALGIQYQLFHLTDRHTLEDHFGLVGDDTFTAFKADLDVHP
ncbi:hypothetical protein D3C85_1225200 [compost metagenome]